MSIPRDLGNYHTHCFLCDGEGAPADYAKVAAEKRFRGLGFSSHAPLPFPVDWVMVRDDLGRYVEEIERARASVKGVLPVFAGLEIDFVRGVIGPDPAVYPEIDLDFTIGSVHFVRGSSDDYLAVDGPIDEFRSTLEVGFRGDTNALVSEYLSNVREMLDTYHPDILGHVDVIRKNNSGNEFFDTSEQWYRREMTAVLDAAARNGCIVEVNTGGLARGRDALYPEQWVVEALRKRNVRMMVNTDAHAPSHLGFGYDRAFELLRDGGYTEHWLLTEDGWRGFAI